MKHFCTTLSLALMLAVSGATVAEAAVSAADATRQRRERPARQARQRAAAPMKAAVMGGTDADKPLYGMLWDAYDGPMAGWQGPVKLDTSGYHTQLSASSISTANGCYFDGKLLNIAFTDGGAEWTLYDATTWERLTLPVTYTWSSPYTFPAAMAYDPVTETIYGCMFENGYSVLNDPGSFLVTVHPDNMAEPVKMVGNMGVRMRTMASDKDGQIYGIGADGGIYLINKVNASLTKLSDIQFPQYEEAGDPMSPFIPGHEGGVIDWATGTFYFSYSDDNADAFLVTVDPATGATDVVANYGYYTWGTEGCDMFSTLWFEQSMVGTASGLPLEVTGLTGTADGTEMSATLTFTMPEADTDGNTISGELNWNVTDGTSLLAGGKAAAGSTVTAQVTVPAAGWYNLTVTAANATGESKPQSIRLFVGPDTPVISGLPMAVVSEDGMSVTLRWNAATSLNGGNLAEPLTYTVVRMPDDVTVAEGVTGVTFTDRLTNDVKTTYTYMITPVAGSVTGEAVASRQANGGIYFSLPHVYDFKKRQNEDVFMQYPTIDVDGDANDWYMHNSYGIACPGSANGMNDYLLVGPFKLEAGTLSTFTFTADGHTQVEHVAAYVGTDPTDVTSFTANPLVPDTEVNPGVGSKKLSADYKAEADGGYYFAIHACSPYQSQALYIYDVSVTCADKNAPAAADDFTVTPGPDALTMSLTVPSLTLGGGKANVTAVNLYRDGEVLASLTDGVTDGAKLTYTDATAARGSHRYMVKAVNAVGEGAPAAVDTWAGLDAPGYVPNLRVVEDLEQKGLIHLTWDTPAAGAHGGYINPDGLTYMLDWLSFDVPEGTGLVDMGSGNSYDLQLTGLTKQGLFAASVYAVNTAGNSRSLWNTKVCYMGPAFELPIRESWAGMGQKSGSWSGTAIADNASASDAHWDIRDGSTGIPSQDGDGGLLVFSTSVDHSGKRVSTPRFTLEGTQNPTLIFYYYFSDAATDFRLEAMVDDKPATVISTLDLSADKKGKWNRVQVPLAEFLGCTYMQINFVGLSDITADNIIGIDNISITDFVANDIIVTAFNAPAKGEPNSEAAFTVTMRNGGDHTVSGSDYTVQLFKNNVMVNEKQGVDIATDADVNVTITDVPTIADPESCQYYIHVAYDADQRPDNNNTPVRLVRLVQNVYPTVTNLQANVGEAVTLTWDDPDTKNMPGATVTETWDSYPAFIIDGIGNWTTYDGDGCSTTRLQLPAIGVLDYANAGAPMAWQVFDPATLNIAIDPWYARSGEQFLISFQACVDGYRNGLSDDWLISPQLSGNKQVISFWATSAMKGYSPETINVLYSTGGTDPEEFIMLQEGVNIVYDKDWTEYFFTLPEGARHFAIVHKSVGKVALLLDDLTYEPAGAAPITLQLQGFNVYRDGVRLNSELITDNEYVDSEASKEAGKHYSYAVTAMWDKGESPLSEPVEVTMTALDGITVTNVSIAPVAGTIRVTAGAEVAVSVYAATGMQIAATAVSGTADIPVPAAGVYFVKAGHKTVKLLVK